MKLLLGIWNSAWAGNHHQQYVLTPTDMLQATAGAGPKESNATMCCI
jgi:hypothetical protein